ncbi:MAG: winged helix DNA-binding domain-containing protein [Solirubrobacteraceae bacterium]|nr:winged helix DNA-binding domain-containing protein [Solirubrobacteraceae bacterium]
MGATQTITLEELGRATLARQHLLERTGDTALEVIERLVGLQSQVPNPAFTGLWSRIRDFDFDELSALMTDRWTVRLTLMRATVHLVSATDARGLRPLLQEVYERQFLPSRARTLLAVDLTDLDAYVTDLLWEAPRSAKDLEVLLGDRWPAEPQKMLLTVARLRLPLVQVPPRGVWGESLQTTYALLTEFVGAPLDPMPRDEAVRRYLAAAGPATVDDFERWSGLVGFATTFAALADRDELLRFTGPGEAELFDLPDAPRPAPDTPAPVRILPEWDSMLMMHADRGRVVDPDRRAALLSVNGIYASSVLAGGRIVAAVKTSKGKAGGVIDVWPFETLTKRTQGAIAAEGEGLLTAMGRGYAGGDTVFHEPGTGYPDRRGAA